MRILYIHQYFCTRQGRSGTRSYEFAKHLVRHGHRVTMLTSTSELSDVQIPPEKRVHRFAVEGIDVVAVRVSYAQHMGTLRRIGSFLHFMALSTWIACRTRGHDLVFATSTPLTVGVPGVCASLCLRVPLVFEVRDLWPEAPIQIGVLRNRLLIGLLRHFERVVYARSAHIIALSPGMRDGVVATGVSEAKVTVIPNCSDVDLFRPGNAPPGLVAALGLEGRFVVVHAGSMGAANGLDVLVDAATCLQAAGESEVLFLLLGQGAEMERLLARVRAQELDNVRAYKSVPRAEVPDYLRASHVCLVLFRDLPVLATNSPNKLFDALAAGRPVIVNSNGWTRELVETYGVGRYAKPGSGAALAAEILWLRDHDKARRMMGQRARQLAERRFDRAILAAQFEAVLRSAAGVSGHEVAEPTVSHADPAQAEARPAIAGKGATPYTPGAGPADVLASR